MQMSFFLRGVGIGMVFLTAMDGLMLDKPNIAFKAGMALVALSASMILERPFRR